MKSSYLNQLLEVILAQKNEAELKAFLQAILTPKELDEICKRLQIIKLMKQGVTQREISAKLKVGVATITRGSHELKKGSFKDVF
jgi:TrpR family transcriptional regulator, trp operon repressor